QDATEGSVRTQLFEPAHALDPRLLSCSEGWRCGRTVSDSDRGTGSAASGRGPGDPSQKRLQVGPLEESVAVDGVATRGDLPRAVPVAEGRLRDAKKARGVADQEVVAEVRDARHGFAGDTRRCRRLSKTKQVCNRATS